MNTRTITEKLTTGPVLTILGIFVFILGFLTAHNWFTNLAFLPKSNHFFVGTLVAITGAMLTAFAARLKLDYKKETLQLPILKFKLNLAGLISLALAIIFYFFLIIDLYTSKYSHYDILYFAISIFLFGFSAYKLFPHNTLKHEIIFNKTDLIFAAILVVLTISINLIGLDRWNFAFSGDEGTFWDVGYRVATNKPWNFFDLTVSYETHAMFDGVYLGLFMKIFGINIISWRMSLVILQAASAVLVYLLVSLLINRFAGVFSGVILAGSHYLMAFNRTGYNNNHIVFLNLLAMLMLALAWRTQRTIYVYLTGVAMGFCLYTYKAASFIWVIVILILIIEFCRRPDARQLRAWALMLMGFLLIISPGLVVTPLSELIKVANQNSGSEARAGSYWHSMALTSFKNTIDAFWIDHNKGHGRYVHGAFVDIVTKCLLMLGIALSIFFFNSAASKMALLWFISGIIIIPFTNYHPNASVTRLMFVLPAVAMLSAISIDKIRGVFINHNFSHKLVLTVFVALLVLIVPLNIYQLHVYGPERGAGIHYLAMIVKAWQEHPEKSIILVSNQAKSHGYTAGHYLLGWYPDFHGGYTYINETEFDTFVKENMTDFPIFLVYMEEKNIALNLSEKLPPQYNSVIDYDFIGNPRTYLFLPNQTLKREFLTEKILRVFKPFKKYENYLM